MMSSNSTWFDENWDPFDEDEPVFERECPDCHGTGYDKEDDPCKFCYGLGYLT